MPEPLFHVSSSRNRASIEEHGLDWHYMGAARGIAGSSEPELAGVFVCRDESERDFFVRMNNTGGPVDVWLVDGVADELVESGSGFSYVPRAVPVHAVTLIERLVPPVDDGSGFPIET